MGNVNRLLGMELVPRTSWYDNVRSQVSREVWKEIRFRTLKPSCQLCGWKGLLFCHEVWKYDDVAHVQKLIGFESLCFLCHSVKHLGLAGIMAQKGQLDYSELVAHYCKVNGCTDKDFLRDRKEAFEVWRRRSEHPWTVDVSFLDGLGLKGMYRVVSEYIHTHPDEVECIKQKYNLP